MTIPAPAPRRSKRTQVVLAVLAVLIAAATAWQVSEFARGTWWQNNPRVAVTPGPDGVASAEGLGVALVEVRAMDSVPTSHEPITALDGHQLWRVELAVEAENSEVGVCSVRLHDTQGREYETGNNVGWGAEGYESFPTCSADDDGEPVPGRQAFLIITPEDSDPQSVRIESTFDLTPRYLELPVP